MNSRLRWFALCALVTLAPLSPARAADAPAPATPQNSRPVEAKEDRQRSCGDTLLLAMGIGAAAGLTAGLVNGHDEVEATLMGAAAPIVAVFALAMIASAGPHFLRPAEARPADLYLAGAPLRGKPKEFLPRALGFAALGLAADPGAGGGRSGRLMLNYVARW